jgi:hypothetical protein
MCPVEPKFIAKCFRLIMSGPNPMRDAISMIVHWASWCAVIVTGLSTVAWLEIIADGNYCWSAFAFTMMATSLGGCTLLLGVIPSSVLYFRKKQPRDLRSVWLTGCSFVILVGEAVILQVIPMRGE